MHPVGSLKPNELGLFDALGNAYEWCGDVFLPSYLIPEGGLPLDDALVDGEYSDDVGRVLRSGSYDVTVSLARSAERIGYRPMIRGTVNGFRPARTYPVSASEVTPW
jgi:formylglycine-generating enzyme required for sulfatase activity